MKKIILILTLLMLCATIFASGHQVYTVLYPTWYKIININYVEGFGYGNRGLNKTLMRISVHYQIKGKDMFQLIKINDWEIGQNPIVQFIKSEDARDFELKEGVGVQIN